MKKKKQLKYTDKEGLERLAYIPADNPLPTRERQILILSIQGLSSKQAGEALGIAVHTIRNNKKRTYKRLKCNNIKQAIYIAIKKGYIEKD